MDAKTKQDLLKFIGAGLEQVGDLATWILSPQRRFHRHEFFGGTLATLQTNQRTYVVRDLGYGGCGLVGNGQDAGRDFEPGTLIGGILTVLDLTMPFAMVVRHAQSLHIGCEFVNVSVEQERFLKSFIQYMDAALQIRQSESSAVFPAFHDRDWLNLSAHRGSLRFHIRRPAGSGTVEATLIFVLNGKHIYCIWQDDEVDIGYLSGEQPEASERKRMLRQIVSVLIGIRQGASLPDFGPVIERVSALIVS